MEGSHQTYYIHHAHQFRFFSCPQSVKHQWKPRADTSSTRCKKIMTQPVPWSPREKFRDSAKDRWLNHTFTSGVSESKTSTTCAKHNEDCEVGAEDWLPQNFELCNDFALSNCQNHQKTMFMPDHPTKVTRTTSIMELLLIKPTNATNCPGQVHRPQHNRG